MTEQVVEQENTLEDQTQIANDLKELGIAPEVPEVPKDESGDHEHEELTEEQKAEEADAETDEERQAIRERRRNERQQKKQYRRDKEDSYKREIEALKNQLREVNEWKNTVESRRVTSGIAQIDRAIKDAHDAVEVAKQAIREATETQNGAALVDAQELYYAARKRAEDLSSFKQRAVSQMQQRPQQNIDPMVVKHAQDWMSSKEWYDPTGRDPDSRIALTIDNQLAEEGWDPRAPEYWQELDERLKKYLPHRMSSNYTADNSSKRRSITSGSSQSGSTRSNAGEYRLSPERVRAMKDAGMWEDPEKRKRMIKRYMEIDKQQNS